MNQNIIFKTIVGSYAYGTYIDGLSDIDYKGIYLQSKEDLLTFKYKEQINVTDDEVYYEVKRFLELLQTANPTMLEMLFMPDELILINSPVFKLIQKHRTKFLTKKCVNSYGGYAVSQIRKARGLNKKTNWEKDKVTRKTPIDFIYAYEEGKTMPISYYLMKNGIKQENCGLVNLNHMKDAYALYHQPDSQFRGIVDENGNDVKLSSIPKDLKPLTLIYFNKDGYSQHCKDYREYQDWLKKRNVNRYLKSKKQNNTIDGKNMLHCRRLLDMGLEIANDKNITIRRPNADYLLKIRMGEIDLENLLEQSEEDLKKMKDDFKKSDLPDNVDRKFVNDLLLEIRNTY
ncbi:MAG: DNA polymerase beta superfamily protein [bacterium]